MNKIIAIVLATGTMAALPAPVSAGHWVYVRGHRYIAHYSRSGHTPVRARFVQEPGGLCSAPPSRIYCSRKALYRIRCIGGRWKSDGDICD